MATDRETPWKELIEQQFERATAFFYEDIHTNLDWRRDVESLEQEFRKSVPEAVTGKRIVDKLMKAISKTRDARFLHFEIQANVEADFAYRVYVYNCCAEIRYSQPIVSLPILIDDDPDWMPDRYEAELFGTRRLLTFRPVKVIRWRGREDELLRHSNPVALFVLAYLEGRRLENDEAGRADVVLRLVRRLKEMGMSDDESGPWLRYFAWLVPLSKEYNQRLIQAMNAEDKEKLMPMMGYWEGIGFEQGRRVGQLEGIAIALEAKFQEAGLALMPAIEKIEDVAALQTITRAIRSATSSEDIRKLLPPATNGQP